MQNKGFLLIEIILVVAVVVLLGFVGWRVWETKKEKPAEQNTEQQNQQANEENKGEEYVTIAEWGVRFKAVEGLEGVEYATHDTDSYGFTTTELSAQGAGCTSAKAPLGLIIRTQTPLESHQYTSEIKEIDDLKYYYLAPQSACSTDGMVANHQGEIAKLFKESINNLEPAK